MIKSIRDTVIGCWRFRWSGLILAWLCGVAGWLFLGGKPNIYHAEAMVFISTDVATQVLASLSADGQHSLSDPEQPGFAVSDRDQLQRIVLEAGMYKEGLAQQDLDALIDRLQQRIWIVDNERWPNAYSVSFRSTDRRQSLRVVEALLQVLAEKVETEDFEGNGEASLSPAEQIAASESRVKMAEQQLADFRRLNPKITLSEESDKDALLYSAIEELAVFERRLVDAERRRDRLEDRLEGDRVARTTDSDNATVETAAEDMLDSRILALQSQLDGLLQNLTIDNPNVVATRNSLDALQARREQQLVNSGLTRSEARNLPLGSSATYRDLFKLVSEANREVAGLRTEMAAQKAKVAKIQTLYDVDPEAKADFESLNRQLILAQSEHNSLLAAVATVGNAAGAERKPNFRIINDPALGSKPVSPNRSRWMAWILTASLGAGAGLAIVLNLRFPVFYQARMLQEATGLPVVGSITHAWRTREQSRFRRELAAFSTGVFALIVGSAAVLALQSHLLDI